LHIEWVAIIRKMGYIKPIGGLRAKKIKVVRFVHFFYDIM